MDNGDRFSGSAQALSGGTLTFKTEFGELKLPWSRIEELRTEAPLKLTLRDGTVANGTLQAREGQLSFSDSESLGTISVPIQEVAEIGPVVVPSVRLEGRISAGASVSKGNTETENYHVDGEFSARSAVNRFTIGALGNYGTDEDNRQIKGDVSAYASYDHFFGRRWYFNSNLGLTHDEFRDLRLRTTAGVGLGYQFRETAAHRLSAELGISYIHENFYEEPDESQPAARWGLDYQYQFQSGLMFVHRQELFWGLEDTSDVLLRTQTGLRVPLFGQLSGGLDVNYDYDWQPPADAEEEDVIYLLKLIYTL